MIRRWLGRIACALDPEWHPGFRGTVRYYFRQPVVRGQHILTDRRTIYTTSWRYAIWECSRCGAPQPAGWPGQ